VTATVTVEEASVLEDDFNKEKSGNVETNDDKNENKEEEDAAIKTESTVQQESPEERDLAESGSDSKLTTGDFDKANREMSKSPLSARNIRRIDDSSRRQPKTGWL
jgi:hypothetical protein